MHLVPTLRRGNHVGATVKLLAQHGKTMETRLMGNAAMAEDQSTNWQDSVIEVYKRDVDRTLLRENLKLSPAERLAKLQDFVKFLLKLQTAGKKARKER